MQTALVTEPILLPVAEPAPAANEAALVSISGYSAASSSEVFQPFSWARAMIAGRIGGLPSTPLTIFS